MISAVFTIGHSNHPMESFLALLRRYLITAVADVRTQPYSRFNPAFSRESFQRVMADNGIAYIFLGRELGARSKDPAVYSEGRVQYRKLAQTALFQAGISRVARGAETHRLALVCAEKEPLNCHRTILIAPELEGLGIAVAHIHADGTLETQEQAMERLLAILGLAEGDLFRTREERIADACARQEERIAYGDEQMREQASA